jgi:hypothetical protein
VKVYLCFLFSIFIWHETKSMFPIKCITVQMRAFSLHYSFRIHDAPYWTNKRSDHETCSRWNLLKIITKLYDKFILSCPLSSYA